MSTLNCPHCQKDIELTDVLSSQVDHQVRARVEEELKRCKAQMIEEIEVKTKKELLALQEVEIEKRKKLWAEDYELEKRKAESEKELLAKQNEKYQNDLKLLRDKELELEKKALEQQSILNEIEIQNKLALDKERLRVEQELLAKHKEEREKIIEEKNVESDLKARQDQIVIDGLKKKIEELSRSAKTDGSQRSQGEALELVGEDFLADAFPSDIVVPIKTGAKGSDVVHTVKTHTGKIAGIIKWEFKRTKGFSDDYVTKLKTDMTNHKANLGVIVTETLPEEAVDGIAQYDNVYVMSITRFKVFARIIRELILRSYRADLIQASSKDLKEKLYDHLVSDNFSNQLRKLSNNLEAMEKELIRDKKQFLKNHGKKEHLIDESITLFIDMYCQLQGITCNSMPKIENLEFDREDGEEFEEDSIDKGFLLEESNLSEELSE